MNPTPFIRAQRLSERTEQKTLQYIQHLTLKKKIYVHFNVIWDHKIHIYELAAKKK
jgi:hypothetical protein